MSESLFHILLTFFLGLLVLVILCFLLIRKQSKKMSRYKAYMDLSPTGIYYLELKPPILLSRPIEEQAKRYFKNSRYMEVNEVFKKDVQKAIPGRKMPVGLDNSEIDPMAYEKAKDYFEYSASQNFNIKNLEIPRTNPDGSVTWRRFNAEQKSMPSGHGQSSKALPFEWLTATSKLSCPHNISQRR